MAASATLFEEGLDRFRHDIAGRYKDPKDQAILDEFLRDRASPEEVLSSAKGLQDQSGEKYGAKKVGDKEVIPAKWIDNILGNINNFVAVGNFAMKGAPESVGMAWFAVKLTLSAIQSNYQLYGLFGSGLTDITEIMVVIKHYDRLYDERHKEAFKESDIVHRLFENVRDTYAKILDFSLSVKRHLSGGKLDKLRHGFKDFFGVEVSKFQGKLDAISALKAKVLESSEAAFQAKTFQRFDEVGGLVEDVQKNVQEIRDWQKVSMEYHEQQLVMQEKLFKSLDSIKDLNKPRTRWDWAKEDFDQRKKLLNPLTDTDVPLQKARKDRYEGTCNWVFDHDSFTFWRDSDDNRLLCLTGSPDVGKSVLVAAIVDNFNDELDSDDSVVLYLSCDMIREADAGDQPYQNLARITGTIIYHLYELALGDDNDAEILEKCNKVFANPKQGRVSQVLLQSRKDDPVPDLASTLDQLSSILEKKVILILDAIDRMDREDQCSLYDSLKEVTEREATETNNLHILVSCRSDCSFLSHPEERPDSIYVENNTKDDISLTLTGMLEEIPGLTPTEKDEAREAVLSKAGHIFRYVAQVAIPFIKQPFQRPLSNHLMSLPEGINETYVEFIRNLPTNYMALLRVALTWTLFSRRRIKVPEIMHTFQGLYTLSKDEAKKFAEAEDVEDDTRFLFSTHLEIEQLKLATGPFLEFTVEEGHIQTWVSVRDTANVRRFLDITDDEQEDHDERICPKCQSSVNARKTLALTEKQTHLTLALQSLRALNDPVFQKRFGLAPEEEEEEEENADENDGAAAETEKDEEAKLKGLDATDEDYGAIDEDEDATDEDQEATDEEQEATDEDQEATDEDQEAAGESQNGALKEPDTDTAQEETQEGQDLPTNGESEPATTTKNANASEEEPESVANGDSSEKNHEDADPHDGCMTDESMDNEEREERAREVQAAVQNVEDWSSRARNTWRYEMMFWFEHVREAEMLWTPEERATNPDWAALMKELDSFATDNPHGWEIFQLRMHMLFPEYVRFELRSLHVAAFLGLRSWAEHLLDQGADIHEAVSTITPLLAVTFRSNDLPMLELLLDRGADLNACDGDQIPGLHNWLWSNPSVESVRLMMKYKPKLDQIETLNGWSVLHYFAASGDDPEALMLLLNKEDPTNQPDVNALNPEGETPLHILLSRRDVPSNVLQAFIDNGADINIDDKSSQRPLQNAARYGDLQIINILLESGKLTDIDDPDRHGRGALHEAAWQGYTKCIEQLIQHGADANLTDKHSRTPLFFACLGEQEETIKFLLDTLRQNGVSPPEINKATKRGRTPLRQLAADGLTDLLRELIGFFSADEAKAAIDQVDTRRGVAALHYAAWKGHFECVKLLLDNGASTTLKDFEGKTPLVLGYEQWALSDLDTFEDIIALLIDQDPTSAANDAELLATAAVKGSKRILEQLNGHQADFTRSDQYGWTPLMLAKQFSHDEAESFLKQAISAKKLPSRWISYGPGSTLSEDGLTITHTSGIRRSLSTDKPIPAGIDKYYYEVTSMKIEDPDVEQEDNPIMAVGFCTFGAKSFVFPGWAPIPLAPSARSWAYHGDDGGFFCNYYGGPTDPEGWESEYAPGDTIGCGIDLITREVWFTLNGEKLESTFEDVRGRLLPIVGLRDNVLIKTNFGTEPFMWKEEEEEGEEGDGEEDGEEGEGNEEGEGEEGDENGEGEEEEEETTEEEEEEEDDQGEKKANGTAT